MLPPVPGERGQIRAPVAVVLGAVAVVPLAVAVNALVPPAQPPRPGSHSPSRR